MIIVFFLSSYWDNFFDKSKLIDETNPFTENFGLKRVEVILNKNPILTGSENFIPVRIKNNGDKKIENLEIHYQIGGDKIRKATEFTLRKLDVDEVENFKIQVFNATMNTSCSEIAEYSLDAYFDQKGVCYVEPKDYVIDVCLYSQVSILVYSNKTILRNHTEWYPYFQGPLFISIEPDIDNKCIIGLNLSKRKDLRFSPIRMALLDISTYCSKGNDPEWCLQFSP